MFLCGEVYSKVNVYIFRCLLFYDFFFFFFCPTVFMLLLCYLNCMVKPKTNHFILFSDFSFFFLVMINIRFYLTKFKFLIFHKNSPGIIAESDGDV